MEFIFLSKEKFFDGTRCHRLTTSRHLRAAVRRPDRHRQRRTRLRASASRTLPSDGKYPAGTVAMARSSDPSSNEQVPSSSSSHQDSTLPTEGGEGTIFGEAWPGASTS